MMFFIQDLLDVLGLFAKFLQLRLDCDHFPRDQTVVGLGADRVDLPVHFLRQKIQHAPDRLLRFAAIVKLLEMTLQAGQFL